jgi:hypothetical protein
MVGTIQHNYLDFFNWHAIENHVLYSNYFFDIEDPSIFWTGKARAWDYIGLFPPKSLKVLLIFDFFVANPTPLQILQTKSIFRQFFDVRPYVISKGRNLKPGYKRRYDKGAWFSVHLKTSMDWWLFIRTLQRISRTPKFKLVEFDENDDGRLYIHFNDFTTIYPFKVFDYDFYSWRYKVTGRDYSRHHREDPQFWKIIDLYWNLFGHADIKFKYDKGQNS